jgi:hypothetical protein
VAFPRIESLFRDRNMRVFEFVHESKQRALSRICDIATEPVPVCFARETLQDHQRMVIFAVRIAGSVKCARPSD